MATPLVQNRAGDFYRTRIQDKIVVRFALTIYPCLLADCYDFLLVIQKY